MKEKRFNIKASNTENGVKVVIQKAEVHLTLTSEEIKELMGALINIFIPDKN